MSEERTEERTKEEHAAFMAQYADTLRDALAEAEPGTALVTRKMFGGMGYYVDGRMFAGYYGKGLALKLAESDRADLLAVEGAESGMSKNYVEVPPAYLRNASLLVPWLKKCLVYVRSLPQKKRKK